VVGIGKWRGVVERQRLLILAISKAMEKKKKRRPRRKTQRKMGFCKLPAKESTL